MYLKTELDAVTKQPIKALIFDLMGTCLDWHTAILPSLQHALPDSNSDEISKLALHWRQAFFDEIHARFEASLPQEDIDETHRRTLLALLEKEGQTIEYEKLDACVRAWHKQKAWPDVMKALPLLKSRFDVIVLANGTTRLQLDITKSAHLDFDLLLSSELLGLTKPDLAAYQRALDLLKRRPEECVMVAAHAYDLRAAKKTGMETIYIRRWTEDGLEFVTGDEQVRKESDMYIDGRETTSESGGLLELVQVLET